jgi:drug/metabolite transporter (DMT)-like permease
VIGRPQARTEYRLRADREDSLLTTPRSNLSGILIMLLAVATFALMDAGLKLLTPHYPAAQVAALRGAASIPFVLVWVATTVGLRDVLRVRWLLHLLRGALSVVMMVAFVYAISGMPLTTAYTLFFIAPLLITALSVPILGEKVGPRRWTAIVVGLVGVVVVLRPTGEGLFSLAGLAVLGAAGGYAVSAITVRVLSRTDSTQSMVFWMVTLLALGAGALALPTWVPIRAQDWLLIAGVGAAGAIGQYAITEAFSRGEASVIAPFEYSALAWGLALDLALWGVLPDAVTWVGAAIIVGSGLYLIRRERAVELAHTPP